MHVKKKKGLRCLFVIPSLHASSDTDLLSLTYEPPERLPACMLSISSISFKSLNWKRKHVRFHHLWQTPLRWEKGQV